MLPACPFSEAAFRLRGNQRTIEARLREGKIEVLEDSKDEPAGH